MPTPILDLTSPKDALPPNTLTRQGSNALGKDQFLKLLVAQLANQDPTKPQDSTQFVAELAQFSALEMQQNTVSRLDTLLMGQATANQTAATTFIGKSISYRGGGVHLEDGAVASSAATLPSHADKVSVTVTDATGQVVRTLQLGAHDAGNLTVAWDGHGDDGRRMPAGDYTFDAVAFDADGKAVPISLSTTGYVSGVAFEGGIPRLKVGDKLIPMSDVTSINERNTP